MSCESEHKQLWCVQNFTVVTYEQVLSMMMKFAPQDQELVNNQSDPRYLGSFDQNKYKG